MKRTLLILPFCLLLNHCLGHDSTHVFTWKVNVIPVSPKVSFEYKFADNFSLGLHAGTNFIGIFPSITLSPNLRFYPRRRRILLENYSRFFLEQQFIFGRYKGFNWITEREAMFNAVGSEFDIGIVRKKPNKRFAKEIFFGIRVLSPIDHLDILASWSNGDEGFSGYPDFDWYGPGFPIRFGYRIVFR